MTPRLGIEPATTGLEVQRPNRCATKTSNSQVIKFYSNGMGSGDFLPARRYASAGNSDRNVSVCLSRAGIVSK